MSRLVQTIVFLLTISSVVAWKIHVESATFLDGSTSPTPLEYETVVTANPHMMQGGCGKVLVATNQLGIRVAIKYVSHWDRDGKKNTDEIIQKQVKYLNNEFSAFRYLMQVSGKALGPSMSWVPMVYCKGVGNAVEGDTTKYHLIVMEYFPQNFTEYVKMDTKLAPPGGLRSEEENIGFSLQILSIVDTLKIHGIEHNDLKPENLMVDTVGRLRLIDFGYATFPGTVLDTRIQRGTALYTHYRSFVNYPGPTPRGDFMATIYIMVECEIGYPTLVSRLRQIGSVGDKVALKARYGDDYWCMMNGKSKFSELITSAFREKLVFGEIVQEMHRVADASEGEIEYSPHILALKKRQEEIKKK